MTGPPVYTEYHPKWHRRPMTTYWWLHRWPYLRFILRELSSVFIAYYVAVTIYQIYALSRGQFAYLEFQNWMASPVVVVLNVVSLFFVLFHAITWFNLAPKAMVVRLGEKPVPGWQIAAGNYFAWLVASALIAWIVLKG